MPHLTFVMGTNNSMAEVTECDSLMGTHSPERKPEHTLLFSHLGLYCQHYIWHLAMGSFFYFHFRPAAPKL